MASFLLFAESMNPKVIDLGHRKPRVIEERKPIRPVRIEARRVPIKVTKPISFGEEAFGPVPVSR
jgi:hypothetical protein